MDLNEVALVLFIVILVFILLSNVYKYGMSRKSFEELLDEQKMDQLALLGNSAKPEKKKEKKKPIVQKEHKKKPVEKAHPSEENNDEELLLALKHKDVKSAVAPKPTAATKKKVSKEHQTTKEHQTNNKTEEHTEKAAKVKSEKSVPVEVKVVKTETSVTFGPAVTKKSPVVDAPANKDHSGILKQTVAAPHESVNVQSTSSAPTRSTDAGPVNADAKKKRSAREVDVTASERIVAAAAPITKASPAVAVQQTSNDAKKPKAHESKQGSSVNDQTGGKIDETKAIDEWTTKNQKGDPNAVMKKQLSEKDSELQMLYAQLQAANARYNESRQEMGELNSKFQTLDRTLRQQLSLKEQECSELKKRIGSGGVIKAPSNDGQVQVIMHLTEENRQLKESIGKLQQHASQNVGQQHGGGADLQQQLKFMDDALKQNSKLLNTSENNRKTLESKLKQIEHELTQSRQKSADIEKKYRETADRLVKAENQSKPSVDDGQLQAYQARLKEKDLQTTDMEAQIKLLETKFAQLQEKLKDQDAELVVLRLQNGPSVTLNGQGNGLPDNKGNKDTSHQYKEMADQLQASDNTIRQLENTNKEKSEELRKVVEELNMLRISHDREIKFQSEKFAEISAKLEEQESKLSSAENLEKKASAELESVKLEYEKIEKLNSDLNIQLERFSEVSNDLDSLRDEKIRWESFNAEKTAELSKLSQELNFLKSSQNQADVLKQQLNDSLQELNSYKEKNKQIETELQQKDQKLEKKTKECEHFQNMNAAQKKEYEHSLQQLRTEKEVLQKSHSPQVCETCSLRQQANDQSLHTSIPNGSVDSAKENNEELEKYKSLVSNLEEENSRKSEELQRVLDELKLLRISNSNSVSQGEQFLEASNNLEQSKVNLEQMCRSSSVDASPAIPQDTQKLTDLQDEVKKYQEDIKRLNKLSEEKASELKKVRDELKDVKRANKDLSGQVEELTNNSNSFSPAKTEANGLEGELKDAKESENKLQSEVQHYQTVLHDTERILRQLQDNVEMEEQNWQQKLTAAQNQILDYESTVRQLNHQLEESQNEKFFLKQQLNQDLVNGSPSIDHKEERIRKCDRAVVYQQEIMGAS